MSGVPMGPTELFIRRPVGTTLIAIGLFLLGFVAYLFLPVASMPSVEFPNIRIMASRPGADPATMAASVAAPLERQLGAIPGVTEITSQSSLGTSTISVQFDLNRKSDSAARDVQAALNAAQIDLPSDLPTLPTFRKANPAAAPVLLLALTSDVMTTSALYDVADTTIAQRIAQVEGVAEVTVPARRALRRCLGTSSELRAILPGLEPGRDGLLPLGVAFASLRTRRVR